MNSRANTLAQFAKSYGESYHTTLSAYSSLARLTDLVDEIGELEEAVDKLPVRIGHGRSWQNLDIYSYYVVGFTSCLEWHARSRLVDCLTAIPSALEQKHLQMLRDDSLTKQIIAQELPGAYLIGAALNIRSADGYVSVFKDIFGALNLSIKEPYDLFRDSVVFSLRKDGSKQNWLEEIFENRNKLVHEISIAQVGHWLQREKFDLKDVHALGEMAIRVIRSIERLLSREAPKDFPRLLDAEGSPIDLVEVLKRKISELEAIIRAGAQSENGPLDLVESAFLGSSKSRDVEMELVEVLVPHNRYLDFRAPVGVTLLEGRLRYLEALVKELGLLLDGST